VQTRRAITLRRFKYAFFQKGKRFPKTVIQDKRTKAAITKRQRILMMPTKLYATAVATNFAKNRKICGN
jgi:hypothetical protein